MNKTDIDRARHSSSHSSSHSSKQRALWFIGLYVGGVIVVASLSYALRVLVIG